MIWCPQWLKQSSAELAITGSGKSATQSWGGLGNMQESRTKPIVAPLEEHPWGDKGFGIIGVTDPNLVQPYAFTSREYDQETGLYYYRARYYDPKIGRFITTDPIGLRGGDVNYYRYVGGDPVNWADPEGLAATDWWDPRFYMTFWGNAFRAVGDFYRNYENMRTVNTIGADKYFHCMANCQASQRGFGGLEAAQFISEVRELTDEYIKRDSPSACNADRAANRQGQGGNPNQSCQQTCGPLRPNGLSPRY